MILLVSKIQFSNEMFDSEQCAVHQQECTLPSLEKLKNISSKSICTSIIEMTVGWISVTCTRCFDEISWKCVKVSRHGRNGDNPKVVNIYFNELSLWIFGNSAPAIILYANNFKSILFKNQFPFTSKIILSILLSTCVIHYLFLIIIPNQETKNKSRTKSIPKKSETTQSNSNLPFLLLFFHSILLTHPSLNFCIGFIHSQHLVHALHCNFAHKLVVNRFVFGMKKKR